MSDAKAEDMARAFFIALSDDFIRVAVHISPVLLVEGVEVFCNPGYFESDSL